MFTFVVGLVILFSNIVIAQRSACSISFPKSNDQDEPVLLTVDEEEGYQLAIPEKGKFLLQATEELLLFCPNPRNKLVQSNSNLAVASCVKNEVLRVSNQQHQFEDYRCEKSAKGDIKASNIKCGSNKGKIIDIGFQVTRINWITLIRVCYDSQNANTLYTEHTIYGQSITQASKQSKRPSFQTNEVTKGLNPNSVYTQANQLATFTELLGSRSLANRYIRQNAYLARGHLAPDADFLFAPLQFATYYYVNTCPQWSNINSGNWKALESMVRRATGKHGDTYKIFTGTHEVLELPDVDGELTNIFLGDNELLPVPKFIWKTVYSENSKQGIAFVSVNNPYIDDITEDLILCQDICSRYNWISDKWDDPDRGFIYCCDIRDLQKRIPSIPKMGVTSVLRA